MVSDTISFDIPSGDSIILHQDGKVSLQTYVDGFTDVVHDMSETALGKLLRVLLLEDQLLELESLRGSLDVTLCKLKPNVMNEYNDNHRQQGNKESRTHKEKGGNAKSLLTQVVTDTLLEHFHPDEVRYFGSLNGYANALNSSTNPVKAATTMMHKPGFSERLEAFLKKNPAAAPAPARPVAKDYPQIDEE